MVINKKMKNKNIVRAIVLRVFLMSGAKDNDLTFVSFGYTQEEDEKKSENEKKNEKLYGFYSHTACEKYGYVVYAKKDGTEVRVTTVSADPELPYFPDAEKVGEVDKWVRTVGPAEFYSMEARSSFRDMWRRVRYVQF